MSFSRIPWTYKKVLLLSGVGLLTLHSLSSQCEARSDDTCAIDDAIGRIEYDIKETHVVKNNPVSSYSVAAYRANKPIEDRYDTFFSPNGDAYVAVFDGHGGWQAAEYVKDHLIANTYAEIKNASDSELARLQSLIRGFERTDRDLLTKVRHSFSLGFGQVARVGSCGLLVYIRAERVLVANAGDVRVVLGSSSLADEENNSNAIVAKQLSFDHNAKLAREQERLKREHPGEDDIIKCKHPEACYVKGRLQPTRSFGDFYLKHSEFNGPEYTDGDRSRGRHVPAPYTPPYITATPETTTHTLAKSDKFLILGSDGVWDFLENQEAVEIVQAEIQTGNRRYAAEALVQAVLTKAAEGSRMSLSQLLSLPPGRDRRTRHDDTTVVVVYLD